MGMYRFTPDVDRTISPVSLERIGENGERSLFLDKED